MSIETDRCKGDLGIIARSTHVFTLLLAVLLPEYAIVVFAYPVYVAEFGSWHAKMNLPSVSCGWCLFWEPCKSWSLVQGFLLTIVIKMRIILAVTTEWGANGEIPKLPAPFLSFADLLFILPLAIGDCFH